MSRTDPPRTRPVRKMYAARTLRGRDNAGVARRLGSAPRRCITTHPTSSPSCTSPTGQEPLSRHETSAWAEPGAAPGARGAHAHGHARGLGSRAPGAPEFS
jgi:hypothetical protein